LANDCCYRAALIDPRSFDSRSKSTFPTLIFLIADILFSQYLHAFKS
jgi:hypothetical protein